MTRFPLMLVTLLLALTAAACGGDRESNAFVGTYSMDRKGVMTEFIRIDRQGDHFVLSLKQGNAWVLPARVVHVEKSKLEALLKQPVSTTYESLGGDKVVLLKLPAGARIGDFGTKTGFAWATEFGLVEVKKR